MKLTPPFNTATMHQQTSGQYHQKEEQRFKRSKRQPLKVRFMMKLGFREEGPASTKASIPMKMATNST